MGESFFSQAKTRREVQDHDSRRACAYLCAVDGKEGCQHTQPHHLLLGRQALLPLHFNAEVALLPEQAFQLAIVQDGSILAYALS